MILYQGQFIGLGIKAFCPCHIPYSVMKQVFLTNTELFLDLYYMQRMGRYASVLIRTLYLCLPVCSLKGMYFYTNSAKLGRRFSTFWNPQHFLMQNYKNDRESQFLVSWSHADMERQRGKNKAIGMREAWTFTAAVRDMLIHTTHTRCSA